MAGLGGGETHSGPSSVCSQLRSSGTILSNAMSISEYGVAVKHRSEEQEEGRSSAYLFVHLEMIPRTQQTVPRYDGGKTRLDRSFR
jgi:hypothetical protein